MNNFDIYGDIAQRTNGDIYVGVVGPVRTGKSTFVTRFMESLVLPNMEDKNARARAMDELPQSADGKTVMTTQPKFVPGQSVAVRFKDDSRVNVRLIDCVGYMVDGAMGADEDGKPRLVATPWSKEEMPFEQAAELGTRKVVAEHSTIAVVVTNDGSITELPRSAYIPAEERVINELKDLGKPFVVVLNSRNPSSDETTRLRDALCRKYDVTVIAMDVKNMNADDVGEVMEAVLAEFPLSAVRVNIPKWMRTLDPSSPVIKEIISAVSALAAPLKKMKDCDCLENLMADSPTMLPCKAVVRKMGQGAVECELEARPELFFRVLSDEAGCEIDDEYSLMHYVKGLSHAKTEFDKIRQALDDAEEKGYGVVMPREEDMSLETPELFRQGSQYGVKLKASAPTLHIMKINVETSVAPIVGSQQQSEYMLSSFETDPEAIWKTNMFGKSLSQLVKESLCGKSASMPEEVQNKLRKTVGRVVNENKGGLICILL